MKIKKKIKSLNKISITLVMVLLILINISMIFFNTKNNYTLANMINEKNKINYGKKIKNLQLIEQATAWHEVAHFIINYFENKKLKEKGQDIEKTKTLELKIYNSVSENQKNSNQWSIKKEKNGTPKRIGHHKNVWDEFSEKQNYLKELSHQEEIDFEIVLFKAKVAGYLSEKIFLPKYSSKQLDLANILNNIFALTSLLCDEKTQEKPKWCDSGEKEDEWLEYTLFLEKSKEVEKTLITKKTWLKKVAELLWNVKNLNEKEINEMVIPALEANKAWKEPYQSIVQVNQEKDWYLHQDNHYYPKTQRIWENLEQKLTDNDDYKKIEKNPNGKPIKALLQIIDKEKTLFANAKTKAELEIASYDSFIQKVIKKEPEALNAWKQLVTLIPDLSLYPPVSKPSLPESDKKNKDDWSVVKILLIVGGGITTLIIISFLVILGKKYFKKSQKKLTNKQMK